MPPERNVPARSRGLEADTCRTPQPIRQTARTPTDSNRAHGMSSSYRSQHVQRAAPARLRHPRRSADPWPTESPDQRSLRLNGIAAPATADPGAIGDLRCSCTEKVSHDDRAFTDLMEQEIRTDLAELRAKTIRSRDGVDRGRQARLEPIRNGDIPVVCQAILAGTDRALQERLDGGTDP